MAMRVGNPVLVYPGGITPLSTESAFLPAFSLFRFEPAFVFHALTATLRWCSQFGEVFLETHAIDRSTLVVFALVPWHLHCDRLSVEVIVNQQIVWGKECELESVENACLGNLRGHRAAALSEYLRSRKRVQDLPFELMFDVASELAISAKSHVVVVTGSVGKTTAKELLSYLLSPHMSLCATVDSWNFPHEICSQIALNAHWAKVIIAEAALGDYTEEMGRRIRPQTFVFTELGEAHTAYASSLAEIALAKVKLARAMHQDDYIFCAGENVHITQAIRRVFGEKLPSIRTVGVSAHSDWRLEDIAAQSCTMVSAKRSIQLRYSVPLPATIVSLAVAIALERFSIPETTLIDRLRGFPGVPRRKQIISGRSGILLDDSYNANPLSMRSFLKYVEAVKDRYQAPTIVIGDMLDLGLEESRLHDEILVEAIGLNIDVIPVGVRMSDAAARLSFGPAFQAVEELMQSPYLSILQERDFVALKASSAVNLSQLVLAIRS